MRCKLASKLNSDNAPTAQEMTDGAGIWRNITDAEKRVLLAYHLDSGIKALTEDNLGKIRLHGGAAEGASNGSVYDIDSHLLRPGSSYTLYLLKEGSQSATTLDDFSTDAYSTNDFSSITGGASIRVPLKNSFRKLTKKFLSIQGGKS